MPIKIEIDLYSREEALPDPGRRVVCFSPAYSKGADQAMAHRIMDAQFVRVSTDVEYWAYADEIVPEP